MWMIILGESPCIFSHIFTVYVTASSQNKYCTFKNDVSELQLVRRQFLTLFFNCAFLLNCLCFISAIPIIHWVYSDSCKNNQMSFQTFFQPDYYDLSIVNSSFSAHFYFSVSSQHLCYIIGSFHLLVLLIIIVIFFF